MARPTKYTPELVERARGYLDAYQMEGHKIPSVAGLSLYLGVNRDTVYTWNKEEGKEEFSDILGKILAKQEETLLSNGLDGTFNSTITKLVLGKHGYSDKSENTNISKPALVIRTDFTDPEEAAKAYQEAIKKC